ncbi:hypothetical protein CGCF415_v015674 [Colletotrichum fructicola]|nr:hypothetical protein CGCF415_v015674 [Colletotrichum fructicola]
MLCCAGGTHSGDAACKKALVASAVLRESKSDAPTSGSITVSEFAFSDCKRSIRAIATQPVVPAHEEKPFAQVRFCLLIWFQVSGKSGKYCVLRTTLVFRKAALIQPHRAMPPQTEIPSEQFSGCSQENAPAECIAMFIADPDRSRRYQKV